jgi:hypothetical protein
LRQKKGARIGLLEIWLDFTILFQAEKELRRVVAVFLLDVITICNYYMYLGVVI